MDAFVDGVYIINDYINAVLWYGVPDVLKGLIISVLFAGIFRKQIKKYPLIFYIYPALTFIWFSFYGVVSLFPGDLIEKWGIADSWVSQLGWLPSGLGLAAPIGIGFLIIVMFVGVLPKNKIVVEFYKIRSEMSIIGATILVAHGIMRLTTALYYLRGEAGGELNLYFWSYGILGPIILLLIILPWITSFTCIRKKMSAQTWKKLQTYTSVPLFTGMLLFGFLLTLAWATGMSTDFVNLWDVTASPNGEPVSLGSGAYFATNMLASKIYIILLALYIVLRIRKKKGLNKSCKRLVEKASASR